MNGPELIREVERLTARVDELLACNTAQVERRREAEADRDAARREVAVAHQDVSRLTEELREEKANHHKLGAWPDCPQCLKLYGDDLNGAHENARLEEQLSLAKKLTEAAQALRVISPDLWTCDGGVLDRIHEALSAFLDATKEHAPAAVELTRSERETIDIALSRGPVATTEARAFLEPDLPGAPRA